MPEFVNLLNANQGLLEFISLIITLIGFFVVNKNIKINNTIHHTEDKRIIISHGKPKKLSKN